MTLASLFSWADPFESYLVENPEDRFSRDEAHMVLCLLQATKLLQFWLKTSQWPYSVNSAFI